MDHQDQVRTGPLKLVFEVTDLEQGRERETCALYILVVRVQFRFVGGFGLRTLVVFWVLHLVRNLGFSTALRGSSAPCRQADDLVVEHVTLSGQVMDRPSATRCLGILEVETQPILNSAAICLFRYVKKTGNV